MTVRRTSAEVVNATLLEVFLAFIFVVLTIALAEKRLAGRANNNFKAQQLDEDALSRDFAALKRDFEALETENASLRSENEKIAKEISTLRQGLSAEQQRTARFSSQFPPPCHPDAGQKWFATLSLDVPGMIRVRVDRDELRYRRGQQYSLTPHAFRAFFGDLLNYSVANKCRFRAQITDDENLPKAAFKRDLIVINRVFYTNW